jgi:hypothetical protein
LISAIMAGGGKGGAGQITLEHTPTWIVAAVCSVIVVISLLFERMLHRLGKVQGAITIATNYSIPDNN